MNHNSAALRQLLRKEFLKKRNRLSAVEIEEKSANAVERITALPAFRQASTILLYRNIHSELSLDRLPEHPASAGKRFAYPVCVSKKELRAFVPRIPELRAGTDDSAGFSSPEAWKSGPFGIPEPDPSLSEEIPPEELDLIICPGVAFDTDCRRLGMGAGYYDRYLPQCKNAVIVMAAFEVQRAERVPSDAWDVPMDMVVTEAAIYIRK